MKRSLGYIDGIGTALALIAVAGAAWLASASVRLHDMYRDMNPDMIRGATKVVLSTAWCFGVPIVLVAALIAAHVWRPRFAIVSVAVVAIAVDVFWYLTAWAPVFAVAGNIRS